MELKEVWGGHPLAADIHCVDKDGNKATPSFNHALGLYLWLKQNGYQQVATHSGLMGVYQKKPAANCESVQEHEIGYAYPTSSLARDLRCAKQGCYTVTALGKTQPHPTLAKALAAAKALGTTPSRWSIDHPANAGLTGTPVRPSAVAVEGV